MHGLNVFGYHVFNLFVHVLNALLVYLLITLLFDIPVLRDSHLRGRANIVALFISLIFISHPVQTEAVTYVTQRFTSLAVLFYLVSLVTYLGSRLSKTGNMRYFYYGLSMVSAVLAMKTKEIAFTLPAIIVLMEFLFFRASLKSRIIFLLPLVLTMLLIPLSIVNQDMPVGEAIGEASRSQTGISRLDYLATQFRVIVMYLRLLIFPVNQNLDYDLRMPGPFFLVKVFISFLLLMYILGIGIFLNARTKTYDPGVKLVSFGIFWFFITLSVESSIIPLADRIFEHRLYLPSTGAITAIVVALFALSDITHKMKKVVPVILAIITLAFMSTTYARNVTWQSEASLWEDVVRKSPFKARGHNNLGVVFKRTGHLEEAIENYKTAIRLVPDHADAHNNLANIYMEQGHLDEAIEHFETSVELRTKTAIDRSPHITTFDAKLAYAYFKLGRAYTAKGRFDKAIEEYESAVELKPNYAKAYVNLGMLYGKVGQYDTSIECSKRALSIRPSVEAYNNLGMAYRSKGDTATADEYFRKAEALRRSNE